MKSFWLWSGRSIFRWSSARTNPGSHPKIEPPEIQLRSDNPIVLPVPKQVPDPGPPVKETTAPEAKPLPPAPQVSTGKPTWEGLVLGALNKAKRYPREAQRARQQGVP